MIRLLKILLSMFNKLHVTTIGKNSDLFCRLDKRNKNSIINIGNNCLINGRIVTETKNSSIVIKNNVFVGGKTIIDCKDEIIIEDNVLISYECIIADHDSHSLISNKREDDLTRFKKGAMRWEEVGSGKITIKKKCLDMYQEYYFKRCYNWRRSNSCSRQCCNTRCPRLYSCCW